MKIKIVSDGTVKGTKLVDVETGKMLENVVSVTWAADLEDVAATVIFQGITAELEANAGTMTYYKKPR